MQVRTRRTSKEGVGFIQAMLWKNNFLGKFEDGQKRDMSASCLASLCQKEEVDQEVDNNISELPKITQG